MWWRMQARSQHPLVGAEGATYQQQQSMERVSIFWFLAEQHRASLDQVTANQNKVNQQMWDQVAQLLASQQLALAWAWVATANTHLPSGMRAQKMTPANDPTCAS